ncbi:hypothetical protein B0I35DRAFT_407205 [Stachybotrys elegans]|uniref:Microbial-type PARG catalytic domain-containing protein n=1 Tax=Stachybotrys elegans TaxID=80388 RepID=A0A8K0SZZ2_9HYPO|nr:hypothetical protein B0I35DRAFT_407205 [Stachybotrys elegans]
MSSSKSSRVKPAEVASETKRFFIPEIRNNYSEEFPPYSLLYHHPVQNLPVPAPTLSTRPPTFFVECGDPVMRAIQCGNAETNAFSSAKSRVPFLCAANAGRPGGDWETGVAGYEERLCRRSNLSATLSTPVPGTQPSNYPIPSTGGILSDNVVVYRGPHDRYEKLPELYDLPVISMAPTRWPKLKDNGLTYSFSEERELTREKLRGALRICLYNNYDRIVIGDFGLGNGYRNPPQELAEMWRDIFLFDPDIRGRFSYVIFVFEDENQSTMRCIHDDLVRKSSRRGVSKSKHKHESHGSSSSPSSSLRKVTDMQIFAHVFDSDEIERVLSQPDPRYALDMITS